MVLAAPSMLLLVGLWIGWGQTRIDLERGRVEVWPLGIPWPAEVHRLAHADRFVVVPVPGISSGELTGGGAARDGLRKLPFAYGAYLLVAVKRVHVVTPLRKLWRNPAKVAAPGLVEPSTRNRL